MDTSDTIMRNEGMRFPPTPPPSSPGFTGLSKVQTPRLPFFTLFQTHFICSCAYRHVSKGEKMTLRVMVSKSAEENITLMRRLLRLENGDVMTFETENGVPVVPDYHGLKSCNGNTVKVMVFIKRNDGEIIQQLQKENARRRFAIYEEKSTRRWAVGREDWYEKKSCLCDDCMLLKEQDAYLGHLQEMVDGRELSSSTPPEGELAHEDEVTFDVRTGSLGSHPEGQGELPDHEVSTRMSASYIRAGTPQPHTLDHLNPATVEGVYHYGRIIPTPYSYDASMPQRRCRASSETVWNKAMPTDDDFGCAAAVLRRMR